MSDRTPEYRDVRALVTRIAAPYEPKLSVFVTHAHPDHFNGLPLLAGAAQLKAVPA